MKKVLGLLLICGTIISAGEPLDLLTVFSPPYLSGSKPEQMVWSPNDSLVAYLWNDLGGEFRNLWIANPQTGQTERLTNFNPEMNTGMPEIGSVGWLTNRSLFFEFQGDIWGAGLLHERTLKRIENISKCDGPVSLSPNGKYLTGCRRDCLWLYDLTTGKEQAVVPDIKLCQPADFRVSAEPTGFRWSHRGDRLAVYLAFDPDDSAVRFKILNIKTGAQDEVVIKNPQKRSSIVRDFIWSPDDQNIVFESVTRNLLERYLVRVNLVKSRMDTLYREVRDTCVPDFGYRLFWLEPENKILYGIDNNSYNHLYTLEVETGRYNAVTRGKWNVRDYSVDATRQAVYFTGTKDRPDQLQLYVARLKTGETVNVSYRGGDYDFRLSNNGQKIAEVFSDMSNPPELYWIDAVPQSKMNRITVRPKALAGETSWKTPQAGMVRNDLTGREVNFRVWLPDGNLAARKYPVIVMLNGLDCLGAITEAWRPEMFACQKLSDEGYLVIMAEYTDLRKAIGLSGKPPIPDPLAVQLSDIKAVLAEVGKLDYVDLSRTGICGWGYGGYLAAMAMFKEAATFRTGAAIIADLEWSHPESNYLRNLTRLLATESQVFQNIDPQKFYHYLGGRFLVIQGKVSPLPDLIETNRLIPDLLAKHKKLDFFLYPWEECIIEQGDDQYDLLCKTVRFFKENL